MEEIVPPLKKITENSELSFIPSNLNQLHKSGRVSGTQVFLSNLLNIKVVISFEDGKPVMKEKVRANKRAKKYVTDLLRSDMEKASFRKSQSSTAIIQRMLKSGKTSCCRNFPS